MTEKTWIDRIMSSDAAKADPARARKIIDKFLAEHPEFRDREAGRKQEVGFGPLPED